MSTNLNRLLGFNETPLKKVSKIPNERTKIMENVPSQAKMIGVFAFTLLIGLIIYSFVSSFTSRLVFFIFCSIILLAGVWMLLKNSQEIFGTLASWGTAVFIWIFVFYRDYKKVSQEKKAGKKGFICNLKSKCPQDGWSGPYVGLELYQYTDPKTKDQTPYIPGHILKKTKASEMTLSFWLRVSYVEWEKKENIYYPVLLKGSGGNPGIWLMGNNNQINFQVSDQNVFLHLDFPFDVWVHYSLVINHNTMEVYKNGLLEKTTVLPDAMYLNNSPLYVGAIPENIKNGKGELPAEMVFLQYYNDSLQPNEIETLYNEGKLQLQDSAPPQQLIHPKKESCPVCPSKKEKTKKKMITKKEELEMKRKEKLNQMSKENSYTAKIDNIERSLHLPPDIQHLFEDKDDSSSEYLTDTTSAHSSTDSLAAMF
jgi:hypothetical protein